MGATSSTNTKRYSNQFNSNIYSTPPKINNGGIHNRLVQLQCDPRSPTGNNEFFLSSNLFFFLYFI
jgi:hypothetical protein